MTIHKTKYGLDVSVEIERDNETDHATVWVIAPMYINKRFALTFGYKASQFSDHQILNDRDFVTKMLQHFPSE